MQKHIIVTVLSLTLLCLSACSKGCAQKAVPAETKSATQVKSPELAFKKVPAISTQALLPGQEEKLLAYFNEEICPCDCPKSFAACLQEGTACKSAVLLGQWLVDALGQGAPIDALLKAVTEEIADGYLSKSADIDTAGYSSKGDAAPEVIVVEFSDFQCPHCQMTAKVIDEFAKKHSNTVQVIYKHFPLPGHPMAEKAAIATEAAAQQGKFWDMHDAIFKNQHMLSDEYLPVLASTLGLNVARFKKDMQNQEIVGKVKKSAEEAQKLGLVGTPSIFFNGRPYNLSHTMEGFELRLSMEKARAYNGCQ